MNSKPHNLKEKIENFERALQGALLDSNQSTRAAALDIASLFLTEENIKPICSEVSRILWYNYNHGNNQQIQEIQNLLDLFYTEPNETCRYEDNHNPIT
jgi:hypothetical protein